MQTRSSIGNLKLISFLFIVGDPAAAAPLTIIAPSMFFSKHFAESPDPETEENENLISGISLRVN